MRERAARFNTPTTRDAADAESDPRFFAAAQTFKGAIVNNLSLTALAPVPVTPAYSISKAAAFNMTQSLRALLAGKGVTVHAVLLGPVDTDMTRGLEIPKAAPESVAQGIFDGLEKKEEDIFPDPVSQSMAEGWRTGVAKAFERQYAAFVPEDACWGSRSPRAPVRSSPRIFYDET